MLGTVLDVNMNVTKSQTSKQQEMLLCCCFCTDHSGMLWFSAH